MARVEVHSVKMNEDRIESMTVKFHNLDSRTIDRATALSWMKDGHSFIPVVDGQDRPALQRVEAEGDWFIRTDNQPTGADAVGAI